MSRSHRSQRDRLARRAGGACLSFARIFASCIASALAPRVGFAADTADSTGSGTPWLFVTVAFVASSAAFFACGHLLATLRRRSTEITTAVAPTMARGAALEDDAAAALKAQAVAAAANEASAAVVEAMGGVCLLAARLPQGLAVLCLNAPARTLWPHAGAGSGLETLPGLSPAARSALDALAPGQALTFDGWRMAMLPKPAGVDLPARYLLGQLPGTATESDLFGSTLSHDLRAPIRVVEGFTRIVKEDYGSQLDRVGNDHLDRVLGAAARMNLMIDALLTMARLSAQPLTRQPVDLSQIAQFVLEDLRRGGSARQVEVEIEPGLQASGDPTLLRLVLENLLGNAWKYTARTEHARIALRAARHDGERAFAVTDNGAGFDMRSADRLFGLFQRLHSANDFPGHGVGLASVRRIVRRHGGDIWAEGRPGQGATFTFTLG